MARKKLETLTEQMYYILLVLKQEICGVEIASEILKLTNGRVSIGPGTLYTILAQFLEEGIIMETKVEGRKRSYIITENGKQLLLNEYQRLLQMISDTNHYTEE